MMYYMSLPAGWSSNKSWPVVFVLEAAEKQFEANMKRFVEARGTMPFILVAPINTNNGNQGRKDPQLFPYSMETWDFIDQVGDCEFNSTGILQIMKDIQNEFQGESKIYITGFEAGAHDLWSIVFNHPEYLNAAAPVAGNFRNRCITPATGFGKPSDRNLPIMLFYGEKDPYVDILLKQWQDAKVLAKRNGFTSINETQLPGVEHIPLPKEVLIYFLSLVK